MKLNVIVPTYNRAESLKKTLHSLVVARLPSEAANFRVEVLVVDNNSTDGTRSVFEEMKPLFAAAGIPFEYLFEEKQGRSFALNSGIRRVDGELLSTVDDDEEIDSGWYVEIEKTFCERWDEIDFASGKILPNLEIEPPSWVEPLKAGALCWRDFGDEEWMYGKNTPMITGAHGIFKKSIFEDIGFYNENLGVKGKGFISCEDDILYDQLIEKRKRGVYNPKLVMYHYVPAYRLSKSYYRRWLFGVGVSRCLTDIHYKPYEGAKLFGVPRWMYRTAVKGIIDKIRNTFNRNETESLAAENQPLLLAGYFYGKNLQNTWADKPLQIAAGKIVKEINR